MRDGLLLLFIVVAMAAAIRYPFIGLVTWAWFTLMTPHQLAYGVFGVPLNLIIAGVTLASIVINGGFERARIDRISLLLILFSGWLFVAQMFSLRPEASAEYFDRFIKTMLFVLIVVQMTSDRLRLHALLWTLMISLGFFAAKGAAFTIATLGQYRVQGIETTVLEDNNHMGIALAMSLPIILYLLGQAARPWMRWALGALFAMTIISILGTHSRGAFLSLVVFCGFYWLQSRHKALIAGALLILLIPAVAFMPAKWTERMTTIASASEDASFMGRVDAWVINTKLALANPITGAGLRNSYDPAVAAAVDPQRAPFAKAAHSIYFEILGGAGFVGLALYLAILGTAFLTARALARRAFEPGGDWRAKLAYYLQIALVVFCVGGASVSLEMWDGYWLVIALIAAVARLPASAVSARPATLAPARPRWRMRARGRTAKA